LHKELHLDLRMIICGMGRIGRGRVEISGEKSNPVGAASAILKDIIRVYPKKSPGGGAKMVKSLSCREMEAGLE